MARKKKKGGINYLFGSIPDLPSKPPPPSKHERQEHAGRVPQVGVPAGPRQTVAPLPGSPAARAGLSVAGPSPSTSTRRGASRTASRAATRQRSLVNEFVTKAYDRKVGKIKQSAPTYEVADRVAKAKDEVESLRERLLTHPAVEEANSAGKVVPPKGLQKLHKTETQQHAITGPRGVSKSGLYGYQPRSLQVGKKGLDLLTGASGMEGSVARTQAKAQDKAHQRSEPSTFEALAYASMGIPGIGLGTDAARLAEVAGTTIPKLFAEGGARQAAKSAGEGLASRAGSIASAPARAAKSVKALPETISAAAKPAALRGAAKAAPKAIGKAGVRSGERSYKAFGGAAAVGGTHKAGLDVPGGKQAEALIRGQGVALEKDPGKVFSSTASLFPGLLVSAFQLPVAAGASAVQGSTKPLEGAANEQVNFAKQFLDTYGSGDATKVEQATLREGLLPEVLVGPLAAKGVEKLTGPLRGRGRDLIEGRRAPAMDSEGNVLLHEHGGAVRKGRQRIPLKEGEKQKLTRQGEKNQQRREEAFHAANMQDTVQLEHAARREHIDKHARKAAGKQTVVREGLGKRGKDKLMQRPPDYLPFLNRAGIDLHNPEAALREIKHYAEKYKELDPPTKYGASPEALTARDAVKFFTDHPEELRNKHLALALDEFRAMQNGQKGLRSLSTSDRNRYLAHAVMHDIPDAMDRVPFAAREHTDATTREGAWKDLEGRAREVRALRKEGRKKYDQAQALDKNSEKAKRLRAEAKETYEKARAIDKGRRELHDELKNYTRPGAKADPNAKRIAYDAALEKEMVDETRASLEAKGLHPEPAYTPDTDAINRAKPDQSATGGQKPLPGGLKINEGYNWRHGLTKQGYEHMMNEAILRQVARNHQFEDWRRFRADRGIEFEGAHQHYGKDWARAFDQGVMNRKDVALVPTQVVNRLEKATQGGDPTEYESALAELQASRKLSPDDAQSGTIYEAYPKAAYEEKVQQAQKTNVPTWLRKVNRYTGMNMLSTPAFVGMQVVAEVSQAIASVNPARMIQGLRAYNKMPLEARVKLSGAAGETAKAIFSPEDLQTTLGSTHDKPFTDALSFFRRNVFGRTAKSFATLHAVGELDRLKGGPVRRAVITGQILRDLNGTWAKGRKLLKLQTEIDKRLAGKTNAEKIQWVTEHPRVMDRYGKELHDNMGGWGNLIRTGHLPESARAAGLVFYPFLRMSLQWPIKYALNHPVKATALAYLAAQNNFALKEALHGEPSFLNYAQIPVYTNGPDGKPTTINLSRAAVGGNALVTAVQGSGSVLGALQPVLAAGVQGATGQGPLGAVEGGVLAHAKAGAASILGLSPYVRAADTVAGQKASGQSEFGILGKRANIAIEPLQALESKLKGDKGEQLFRSLVLPALPQDINKQRDYAKLGRVLGDLSKYGSDAQSKVQATSYGDEKKVRKTVVGMQKKYDKAHGELEALYKKHGLAKVAKRSEEIYFYTHPYPGSEEKSGGYKSGGYESSGYESGGYGGGTGPGKPPAFPHASDSGVSFNIPGLPNVSGAIPSFLSALVGGEVAQAATRKKTTLTGPLSAGEKTFAKTVAKETGLKPQTVAAWTLLEGGNSTGDYNRLNVGHTDSGPLGLTADSGWKNPVTAGKLTAEFLKGNYGGASEGIQAILPAAKGKSPAEQLNIIANSGWATDPAYASKLQGTLASVGVRPSKPVPKRVMKRFQAGVTAAKELESAHLPYVWGGGHGDPASRPTGGGLDCSGAVSYVLNKMGVMKGSLVSGDMGSVLRPGPGAVTVFYSPTHTFMRIGKKYFGTSSANAEGGAGFIPTSVAGPEASSGSYNVGHVAGLGKKVAVALGVPTGSTGAPASTSFPGMTLANNGTTATIDPAAASTVKKPGFSDKPIKLTPAQKLKQVNAILRGDLTRFGIPASTPAGPSVSSLAALGRSLESGRQELARL